MRFRTADAVPLEYAATQNNLGLAYAELPAGDRAGNLGRAIGCYTEALRFCTAEAAPAECRMTATNLGDVHFEQGRWMEADVAYSEAIRAGEFLYHVTGSEPGRQAELWKAGDAVAADAYCLARLGRFTEAVQRLEAGRARALGEALARDRAALEEAKETDRLAFVAAADRVRTLEAEGRRGQDSEVSGLAGGRSNAERSTKLVQAREDLTRVIERIRVYLPGFAGEGLDYQEVAAAASPARPLAYMLTTSQGSLALLVPAQSRALMSEHAVWLDGFTAEDLDELLMQRRRPDEVHGGYLAGQMADDLDQLTAAVTEVINSLRRELLGPLARSSAHAHRSTF